MSSNCYVSSYCFYICVLIYEDICPHTASVCVSSFCFCICVLILLLFVSSYCLICVLILGRFGRFGVAVTIVEGESERKAIQVMATELLVDIQVSLLCLFFYFS